MAVFRFSTVLEVAEPYVWLLGGVTDLLGDDVLNRGVTNHEIPLRNDFILEFF